MCGVSMVSCVDDECAEMARKPLSAIGAKRPLPFTTKRFSEFDLSRDFERIIDLDTQIPNCAFELCMAEEQLDRAKISVFR